MLLTAHVSLQRLGDTKFQQRILFCSVMNIEYPTPNDEFPTIYHNLNPEENCKQKNNTKNQVIKEVTEFLDILENDYQRRSIMCDP